MKTVLRGVAALFAGVVVGGFVNMAVVMAGPALIPAPAGVEVSDAASVAASAGRLEARHFLFPFLAHALGTLSGATVAFLVAATRRSAFAYAVGAFFLAGGIAAASMIPAPAWFVAVDLAGAYLPMAWLATRIGRRMVGSPVPMPSRSEA